MSNDFGDESENEGASFSNEDIQNLFARLAASGNLHIRHTDGNDDDEENEDEDFDDEEENNEDGGQQFSIGFGMGSDGSVTPLEDDGAGRIGFSFTLDEDGEEVPEIGCPRCNKNDTEELDGDTDTYECNSCGLIFVPRIYRTLDSSEAYMDRSWQNFQQKKYKRAIKDAAAAIKLEPKNRKAYLSRGKALVEKEEFEGAESDFSEAIRISPDYDVAYFERGRTRMFLQKFDKAIADLTKSIGFDPDFAETYRLRAVAHLNLEQYKESANDLSEALKRDPSEAQTWFERGFSYSLLGEHEKAIQDYSEAIRRDPNHRDSFVRRAESFEKLERYQDAITDYKNFLRTIGKGSTADEITERINNLQLKLDPKAQSTTYDPDEEVPIWKDVTLNQERKESRSEDRGRELMEKGNLDGAYKEFSAYIKHVPNSVLPYIYRACVSLKAGRLEDAVKDLTAAIECGADIIPQATPFSEGVDPRYENINLLRAYVNSKLGKQEEVQNDLVNHLRFRSEKSYREGTWSRRMMNRTAVEALGGVFAGIVTEKPEETRTPLQNALLALIMDDRKSAQKAIKKAIQSDSKNPVNYWVLGLTQAELDDAFKDFATATEHAGGKAEHFYVQGFKKMLNNKVQEGREDILKALGLDPNNAEYHEKLGVFLSKSNQHDEAIEHLTKAIALNPDSKDAYFMRGVSLDWKGETQSAMADLEEAIALEDKPGNAKTKAIQEKIQEINESEAKKQNLLTKLDAQSEKLGSAGEYITRGEASLKAGKWEPAYADFNEAIKQDPKNANAFRFRGATYYKLGDAKSALKDYNQAIALEPNNSEFFLNRGILQADSGDSDNALANLDEAIRLNPKNAMAYHMRAKVHGESWFDENSIDQATEDFEQAIKLNRDDPQVYVSRAEFWGQPCFRNTEKDALADLDQAIRLAPDNAAYYLARFKIKADLKDATGASQDLTKAYELDPTNEEVKGLVQKFTGGDNIHAQVTRLLMSAMEKINAGDVAGSTEDLKHASELDADNEGVKDMLSKIPTSLLNMREETRGGSEVSPENEEKALKIFQSGFAKYEAEDYDGCINELTEAITLDPSQEAFFEVRGSSYLSKGMEEEAYWNISESIRLGNKTPMVYIYYANWYLGKELYQEALDVLGKVVDRQLEMDDDDKRNFFQVRGDAHLGKDLYEKAISDYSMALSLNPGEADLYYNRGEAYQFLHEYKSSISDFQTFIELTDDKDVINEALGFIEEMTASISTDPTLRSSTKHSPEPKKVELSNAHCVRAYELNKSKNFAGALKEVQLAKYLTPDEKPPFEIAFAVYNDMQDWNNGIANLMEVIRIKPDDVMAHVNLGALKTKIGVLDGAVSILIKATQLDPKHANSHLSLGTAYLMQGNYKLALDSLTNSINLDPSVPVAYLHRASVKEKLKDYVAAIPDFEKYCELGGSPEVPDLAPLREHIKDLRRDYELLSPAAIQLEKRKQKMQKEIDERNLELEQLKRDTAQQVDSLQKEREKLGFLAISKKKDIDQRIISLENRLSDFSTTVESLRKQLTELKL